MNGAGRADRSGGEGPAMQAPGLSLGPSTHMKLGVVAPPTSLALSQTGESLKLNSQPASPTSECLVQRGPQLKTKVESVESGLTSTSGLHVHTVLMHLGMHIHIEFLK